MCFDFGLENAANIEFKSLPQSAVNRKSGTKLGRIERHKTRYIGEEIV